VTSTSAPSAYVLTRSATFCDVSIQEQQLFDDLTLDYSLGEVLQALSVLGARGEPPQWSIPYSEWLSHTLTLPPDVPPYVVEAAAATCQAHGYSLPMVVEGLQALAAGGYGGGMPSCGMRTLRGFLEDWRKQLRQRRPMPKFSIRPR
jgi:hypothetical protein